MMPEPHESTTPSTQIKPSVPRMERIGFALLLLIFTAFTWRGMLSFFTGDDVMNMYWAWTWDHKTLTLANLLVWVPMYRPLGETIYLAMYSLFGFQPAPLYVFCWLLLVANVFAAYALFRSLFDEKFAALTAVALILVHGAYIDLYNSAGTIFDHLWFTFTVLGVAYYVRARRGGVTFSIGQIVTLWLLCVLAMDSKESGVTLPVLFACYEALFVLPRVWSERNRWLRFIAPLYLLLTATSLAFVFGRVFRTQVLAETATYHPQASLSVWLTSVAAYFDMLCYRSATFGAVGAAVVLLAIAALALLLRSKVMGFGLLWFIVTITPVALITPRPGYVIYVPAVGFGLYFGEFINIFVQKVADSKRTPAIRFAAFLLVALAGAAWHRAHWPATVPANKQAYFQLADQFQREYPSMKGGAKILFASDFFPPDVWDMTMMLRLLYRDKLLDVRRLHAAPEMQPAKGEPRKFDYVFATAGSHYEELENRNIEESMRLHLLRNYTVGRKTSFGNRDHSAYVVSGVKDFDGPDPGRWTEPVAVLKFDTYPADCELALRYLVPNFVAKPPLKTLTVRVNGDTVGTATVEKDGDQFVRFPVKASQITRQGFTMVELSVDKPYKDAGGNEYGVVLNEAGFEYPVGR